MADFADRLRRIRKDKKLTQSELARTIGVHYVQIGRYELRQSRPSAVMLIRLAAALDISIDHLVYGSSREEYQANLEDKELLLLFREIKALSHHDKIALKKILSDFILERQKRPSWAPGPAIESPR